MAHTTIRIREETHAQLKKLAREEKATIQGLVEKLIEDYEQRKFIESVDKGYAELRADPKAWAEELAERKLWDSTLMDGLRDEPPYFTEDARPVRALREKSAGYRKRGRKK